MANQFPNQMHQASVGPPPGHYALGNRDGNSTQLSSFFGPPSSANDNPFSSFGSDGPTTMNPPEKYPSQSEMNFSLETSSHAQMVDASSVNPNTSQAANIASFSSHTAVGLFSGGDEVEKEEPDDLFSSSSLHLQSDPPLHFPPPHLPLDLSMPHLPAVNPATGAASSTMQLEDHSPLLPPLSPMSVNPTGHSLEPTILPLSVLGHGQVPNMMESSTSELLNDDSLQPDDFLSFVKQPQSFTLPVRVTSVLGQASVQGHASLPPHSPTGKSTSTPSTGLIHTASLPSTQHQNSLSDAMLSDTQQSFPVESGGDGREEPAFLQKGGSITTDFNPLAAGTDVCSHSNTSSTISSPTPHSIQSNADKSIRAVPYGDQTFTYQHRTNADPEFNTTNSRGAQKGPLTNLEINTNVPSKLAAGSQQEFGMEPSHDPLSASNGTNISERYASVYMTSGSADVAEKHSSLSSSLNKSLCSLMDNQDDLAVRISPVRLMAPAPFIHEMFPSSGPPMTLVGEISVDKFSDLSLLPTTSLSSTVRSSRCEQAVAAISGSNHSECGNDNQDVHRPPVSSNISTNVHHGIQEFVGVQNYSSLADNEKSSGSMVSREAENHLATMTRPDGGAHYARTDAARAATLVGGSAGVTSSVAETERPDSLEDWEIVEKASNSTAGSASDAPLVLQSLPSGAVTTSTNPYGLSAVLPSGPVQLDEQGCRSFESRSQQLCPSVSAAPLDTLLKLRTPQPASVSIPPGSASFPTQPLLAATSVFSSQTVAPGLLSTDPVVGVFCSDTPPAHAGGTSNVSSIPHSFQTLSTSLEPTSHQSVSTLGPTSSSLSGLPASAGPILEPTLYSSCSNLEPTSYSSGSNLEPTLYSSGSILKPTSYSSGSNLEPTSLYSSDSILKPNSYSSGSNLEPTSSSSYPNLVPATVSSSGPILEATLPPTRTAARGGPSRDMNPPPQADTGQQRDHVSTSGLAPSLTPAVTTRVTAINPLQRTSLGQFPQSSLLGHLQQVAPRLTGSGGGANEMNAGQIDKHHMAPTQSRPMTTAPEISEHLKEEHALGVGVMGSQRTQALQVAKPFTATKQPETYHSGVVVPVSSSNATSGIGPYSEPTALVNKVKPVLGSALTTAPVLPQSTPPVLPESQSSTSIHFHDLTGLATATGDGTASEISPPTTVLESTIKNEMSATALTTSREVRLASDVNPAPQDGMATEPSSSNVEEDAPRSIQTQPDEALVRPTADVVDGYAPNYHGDYNPTHDTVGRGGGYAYDDRYRLERPYPDPMYQPRPPDGSAGYGMPDHYGYHHAPQPPHHHTPQPPHHQDYRGYYSGQQGYDTQYADPYRHPPDPYFHQYRPEFHSQPQVHQGYQHDPRYGYPPQHYGHPSYRPDPRYARDVYNDGQYRTDDAYSDEYYHQQQYLHAQLPSTERALETENPTEPSMIQGGLGAGVFEISDVYNSPSIPVPTHPHMPPLESTCLEQPENPLQWDGAQHVNEPYSVSNPHNYQEEGTDYVDGGYSLVASGYLEGYHVGQTLQNQEDDKERECIPAMPPSPERTTPEHYYCSHLRTAFCFGGQLVTVLPSNIGMQGKALVEILSVRDVLMDEESRRFVEAVTDSCDPFIPGETPKSVVFHFASGKARQCREKKEALISTEECVSDDADSAECLENEALLWEFLTLLCQQNGVIVPSDVADLLMRGRPLTIKPSMPRDEQECLDHLRQLLLSGRKKNALDYACSKSLWGHALMLASRMDEQSRTYVVNRFTASLASTDPLSTFYTLLLGRTPAAVKQEGLTRAGDWRPHLSMILANKCNKLDNNSIVSLGDSLLARKNLCAAHLCYYLADVHFGSYGDASVRYSLFGVDQSVSKAGRYPWPYELWKMEVLEYALSLTKHDFSLPSFQVFKLLHVLKLVEFGFLKTALKYCEQISYSLLKAMDKYVPTVISTLLEVAVRLHHLTTEFGMVESELPSWLCQLELSVTAILSTDYTPNLLSQSPAFSSVSQTYSCSDAKPQLIIGLQQDNSHLTVPQTHVVPHLRPKEDDATPYMYNRDGGTVGGVETFHMQTAANSIPGQVLDCHSNSTMKVPLGLDGGEGVVNSEGMRDYGQTVEPGEASVVQQYPVLDGLVAGAGEVNEVAAGQLFRDQSGEELYREQEGVQLCRDQSGELLHTEQNGAQMNKIHSQGRSLQVQDGSDGLNAAYGYGGASVPGDVGGSVAVGGMVVVEGERMMLDGAVLNGQHQLGQIQSIAPPQFSGRGYDFSLASGQATSASSTEPTHGMPVYDWSQPTSSSHALAPPAEEFTERLRQDTAKREPDVQQQGSGDNHVIEEREHKSEEKSKKEL